ncbi:Pyridoxal-5'-phosphate-dependent protein beta subunit [Parafrankia sp. EUN1f]|nr:Pyridoxal-5'-phosphate-dependent protein beta subunit [Parafrankia sp. EUN1f]
MFLKCELLHPGRSHKARVARALVDDAEIRGKIFPGCGRTLLERTGGNLGIGLAIEARCRGYELMLITDPDYSPHKRAIARRLGATVLDRLSDFPGCRNNQEAIDEVLAAEGERVYYLDQFHNPANPKTHLQETGPELLAQLVGGGCGRGAEIVLVGGLGTGATMHGISTVLKSWFDEVKVLAIEPPNCDLVSGVYGSHGLEGIAVGEAPPFFSSEDLDGVLAVDEGEAAAARMWLLRNFRLLVGPSSAANVAGIAKARESYRASDACRARVFVAVLYDRGEDYD